MIQATYILYLERHLYTYLMIIFYVQQFENLGTQGKNLCRILLNTCWIESLTYPTTLSMTHFSPVSSDKNPNFTPHPVDALTLQPFTTHIPTCVCFLLVNPESVFHRILDKSFGKFYSISDISMQSPSQPPRRNISIQFR